jgi:glycosyltransferase involved in cell wall biosynthesis
LNSGYFLGVRYPLWMAKKLRRMDVLHAHHPFVSGRIARRHARPEQPVILTTHTRYDIYGHYLGHYMGRALPFRRELSAQEKTEKSEAVPLVAESVAKLATMFANRCDRIVAPSASMGDVLRRWGVETRIEVVPNGIELERFYRAVEEAKYLEKSDELRVIYVGRIASEKNLSVLIQAFALMVRDVPKARLHLVGEGPQEAELKNLCAALGIENSVVFRGALPYNEVPHALAQSDLFASASVSEVHPLTFIEAMAAGLSCVGTPSPGVIDSIEDGKNGWLAAPEPEIFANALREALQNEQERRRRAQSALESSRDYAIAETARRTTEIYSQAMLQSALSVAS